jgi:hypothetical protein
MNRLHGHRGFLSTWKRTAPLRSSRTKKNPARARRDATDSNAAPVTIDSFRCGNRPTVGWLVAPHWVGGLRWITLLYCCSRLQSRRRFVLGKWFCESVPTALARRYAFDLNWTFIDPRCILYVHMHTADGGTHVWCVLHNEDWRHAE